LKHYFLETSAFVKLFVKEEGTDFLIRLVENVEDTRKLVSSFVALEVRSVFRKRLESGQITEEQARTLIDAVAGEANRIVEHPANASVMEMARYVLDRHALSTIQAIHLATALTARDILQIADVVFVSADEQLLEAAKQEGLEILNPVNIKEEDFEETNEEDEEEVEGA
jgi:predicted nucleic acid-binding protein